MHTLLSIYFFISEKKRENEYKITANKKQKKKEVPIGNSVHEKLLFSVQTSYRA
jgi:hypothetical protein